MSRSFFNPLFIASLILPTSLAFAQSGPMAAAAPRAVPAGQAAAQAPSQLGGSSSASTMAPQGLTAPTEAAPGFVPPVNSVTPMPNSPINYPGRVNAPANQPAAGSGLGGTNSGTNTSPFAPSQSGTLGSSPQIGTGNPTLGTPTGVPMTPPAAP